MDRMITLYKEFTVRMLEILEDDNLEEFNNLLDKRQSVIDKLDQKDLIIFKKLYKQNCIDNIDETMKELLENKRNAIKKEIKDFRSSKQGNSIYVNIQKEKLNIFSQKV